MKKDNFKIIFIALLLFSCSDDKLPQFNQINKMRIIALKTITPEVDPGATVTVEPFISDINETSQLTDTVYTCIDPGLAYGAEPSCDNNPTKTVIHTNRVLSLPGLGSDWTGFADSFTLSVPIDAVIFSGRTDLDRYNGVNFIVDYRLKNSSGLEIKSIRRIVVSEVGKIKNLNPTITQIFSNGTPMTVLPIGTDVSLTSDMSNAENYQIKLSDGTLSTESEVLTTTWMITDGETKYFRTLSGEANTYTGPDATPTGHTPYIIAVVRDGRGGVDVVFQQF